MFLKYKQFILFCCVGALNSLISYIVYALLVVFTLPYPVANFLGDVGGAVNSYLWNSKLVFREGERRIRQSLPRFIVTFAIFSLLSFVLIWLFVDCIGIPELWAKLVSLPITTVVNFLMNKLWAFKKRT